MKLYFSNTRVRRRSILLIRWFLLGVAMFLVLFPILALLSTSVKIPKDYYSGKFLFKEARFDRYQTIFTELDALRFLKNSFIVSIGNLVLTLVLSIPAAYGLVRYRREVSGGKLSLWILIQRMLPPVCLIIPLFVMYMKLGFLDSYLSLIIAYAIFNIPFAVWLLMGFFEDFPMSLVEQAMVEGCSELRAIFLVVLPLLKPAMVVTSLFVFLHNWQDLIMAISFTRFRTQTLMIAFTTLLTDANVTLYGEAAAFAVLGFLPVLIIAFVFLRKYLVSGLVLGGVKG
ncbi:MAG: carbohydrate ABC transporter permease [Deltaproteobacteria bacterium]|nr:carbohydrate ABC transporter permease [Deltaproteobacteria bacterium]MBW2154666.1 carbohydrate ABC transporter permease [Deltaproteobacteria bacterium]